jgi:hypothetical protein
VTETGLIDFGTTSNPSLTKVEEFMTQFMTAISELPYVEKVFWYRIGPGDGDHQNLFGFKLYNESDGSVAPLGTFWKTVGIN